jgi:predicted nucleic acid-binding protein
MARPVQGRFEHFGVFGSGEGANQLRICVDTTILIDVLKDEFRPFQEKLYDAIASNEQLVSPVVVFGELMPQFRGEEKQVAEFLSDHKIAVDPLDTDSVSSASKSWLKYLHRKEKVACPHCGQLLPFRKHFLSDFYVGGFALAKCDAILTRDRGIYRKYFPRLVGYANCLA